MSMPLEDKLAVHELLSRAAFGYDERQLDMLAACFTPDATFSMRIAGGDLVGPFEGREAIMGLMTSSMESQTDVRRHVISNIFFDTESSDDIEVVSNLTLLATENSNIQLLSAGVYHDRVNKTQDGWQIQHRHLDLDTGY